MVGESEAMTNGIRVTAKAEYVEDRSDTQRSLYFFRYDITIENHSDKPVQLLSRHWIITNGRGEIEEVKGEGVVGEQPRLEPGTAFSYASACPLETEVGSMRGTYQMEWDDGETFDAEVAAFTLAAPYSIN